MFSVQTVAILSLTMAVFAAPVGRTVGPGDAIAPNLVAPVSSIALAQSKPASPPKSDMPSVGDLMDMSKISPINDPGKYGLANAPSGDIYVIVANRILRIDPENGQVLSIVRWVEDVPN